MTKTDTKPRTVRKTFTSHRTLEGGGVPIGRAFPTTQLEDVDPFLLMDHMGPLDIRPGDNTGFPNHPHRGFETVTYLLAGQMEHRDSFGHRGFLEPGDVQWMTAGSGLVHSEMPGRDLVRTGGKLEGFQIWINLPRREKMSQPHYQELKAAQIPTAANDRVKIKVIAGEALGVRGAIESRTPMLYLHLTLESGASHTQEIRASFNALAYVINGQASFEGIAESQGPGRVVLFSNDGADVTLSNSSDRPVDLLLLAGEPINEPVARYGPFVMNTREELVQAFDDFRTGKMGHLD